MVVAAAAVAAAVAAAAVTAAVAAVGAAVSAAAEEAEAAPARIGRRKRLGSRSSYALGLGPRSAERRAPAAPGAHFKRKHRDLPQNTA